MEALFRRAQNPFCAYEIVLVVSDCPDAPGIVLAQGLGIPTLVQAGDTVQLPWESRLLPKLQTRGVEVIALAGFMRILGKTLLGAYERRILNIHPSLLPGFKGRDAQEHALEYGVKYAGCTVHIVDSGIDSGPILGQEVVPVHDTDTKESLAARILEREHHLYGSVLDHFCRGEYRLEGRKTSHHPPTGPYAALYNRLHFGKAPPFALPKECRPRLAVSACLLGIPCRYDGASKRHHAVERLSHDYAILPVCPEVLSRFWIPRPPMEFKEGDGLQVMAGKGRVENTRGEEVTAALREGTRRALTLCERAQIVGAVLKSRSPSCGNRAVYRLGNVVPGQGTFASALTSRNIKVISEEELACAP